MNWNYWGLIKEKRLINVLFKKGESGIVWTKRWKYIIEPLRFLKILRRL